MFSLHPRIHELMEQPLGVGDAMQRLIDAHQRERPDGDWKPYRRLPFDEEAVRLSRRWFPAVISDDPPVRVPVRGLFFGLFQPEVRRLLRRRTVADFYVGGAAQFEEDSTSDWEWASDPAYFPHLRYAGSPVLAEIYRLAYDTKGGLGNDAEESLCLGFVAFACKSMFASADLSRIVARGERAGVAVGWDSGTPLYLGWLSIQGFEVRPAADAIAGIERRRAAFEAMLRRLGHNT